MKKMKVKNKTHNYSDLCFAHFLLTAFGAFYSPVRNGGHTTCKSAILAVVEVPFPTAEMCLLWIKYFTEDAAF